MVENTFVLPIVNSGYVFQMLESLKKYAGHEYQLILIDQTREGIHVEDVVYVRPNRNLGFAKAMNLGIQLAKTKYITYVNDDVLFLDERWWQGILDTFAREPKLMAINPLSPKEPGWGYGPNVPDWGVGDGEFIYPKGREMFVPEAVDYTWLITQYKKGWIDGIAGWCVVLEREKMEDMFDKEGTRNPNRIWFDERFYPGGGEDYDVCHRLYGVGYRAVATCSSYVWHHWGKSTNHKDEGVTVEIDDARRWNRLNEIYEESDNGWRSPIFSKNMYRKGIIEAVPF